MHDELQREPTDQELSDELNIPAKRIAQYRKASIRPSSMDSVISEGDSHTFADIIPDEKTETPYRHLEEKTNTDMIREVLTTLDAREQKILRYRFGLGDDEEQTLEEIGVKFGVTRERIRQIQEEALGKLRRKIKELETVHELTA